MTAPMVFESPCDADLDSMPSFDGGRRRFCSECMKSVHMLSEMTRDEARAFARDNRGACMSYRRGADGRIEFRAPAEPTPAPLVAPTQLLRGLRRPTRAGLVAAPVFAALAGCTNPVVVADAIEDDGVEFVVESQAFAEYAAIPEATPCEAPPAEEKEEPRARRRNNEALERGKFPEIGKPGHYAGGLSVSDLDDDPLGGYGPRTAKVELSGVTIEGADEALVRRVVRGRTNQIRSCVERDGIDASAGDLSVRFVIDATGRVLRSSAHFAGGAAAACVVEAVSDWTFPEPERASATVVARFDLS